MSNCKDYLLIVLEDSTLYFTIPLTGETVLDAISDRFLIYGYVGDFEAIGIIEDSELGEDFTGKDLARSILQYNYFNCHILDITDPKNPINIDIHELLQEIEDA